LQTLKLQAKFRIFRQLSYQVSELWIAQVVAAWAA
jgi:hypothetical protein